MAASTSATTESSGSTSERLLATAARLFREKGYAASTTRELSARLGITKASLYHHIRGKEDLLYEISVQSLERISTEVEHAAAEAPDGERLPVMIKKHLECALRDRDLHSTMLIDLDHLSSERRAAVIERRDSYQRLLRDTVAAEQAAGRLRGDIDAAHLTLTLLNVLNWTIFWFNPEGELEPGELGAILTDIYLDGARGTADNGEARK